MGAAYSKGKGSQGRSVTKIWGRDEDRHTKVPLGCKKQNRMVKITKSLPFFYAKSF